MTQKSTSQSNKKVVTRVITRTKWAISVTVPLALEDKLRKQAKKKNTTMSQIVTDALEKYFQSSKSSG